jgi:hypothetical protein
MFILFSIILIIMIEIILSPRFDYTDNGNLFLWYGRKKRKYIKIF